MHKEFEESFATDPWYVHLYRTGHAYHGVHPFYMWYWCAHALAHLGPGHRRRRRPQGRAPARLLAGQLARRRPRDRLRRGRPLPHAHPPAQPADLHVGRALMARLAGCSAGCGRPASPWPRRRGPPPSSGPTPSARSGSTTTTSGPAATRSAWPAPWCWTTSPGRRPACWPRPPCAGWSTSSTSRARSSSPPTTPATSTRRCCSPTLPGRVPPPHRRGRGVGLLLRPHLEVGAVVLRPGRHPDRAQQGEPQVGRHGRRAGRGRLEPRHLPRGRALARRLDPALPGRRRLPGPAHRPTRGAGVPARHPPRAAQERPTPAPGRRADRAPSRAVAAGCGAPPSPSSSGRP